MQTALSERERSKLEDLHSYAARPSFSNKRLSLKDPQHLAGDFVYELKSQWTDAVCSTRLNPDQWERVDSQPHIALMLVALNIEPHPPPIAAAREAGGRLIIYDSENQYVDCDD